jgi:hypothetical protein
MAEQDGRDARWTGVAEEIRRTVELRAAFDQAIGVLRSRRHCTNIEARDEMCRRLGQVTGGPDAEAARIVASVDAVAEGRADPELG